MAAIVALYEVVILNARTYVDPGLVEELPRLPALQVTRFAEVQDRLRRAITDIVADLPRTPMGNERQR